MAEVKVTRFKYPGTDITMSRYLQTHDNEYHSIDDRCSYELFTRTGQVTEQMWHDNGQHHRVAGPAWIEYFPNGTKVEKYFYHGVCINSLIDDGTIIIEQDGSIPKDSLFTLEMMNIRKTRKDFEHESDTTW